MGKNLIVAVVNRLAVSKVYISGQEDASVKLGCRSLKRFVLSEILTVS